MTTIPVPAVAGSRKRAQGLAEPLRSNLSGETIVVDCRNIIAATESFADELLHELAGRNPAKIHFANVSDLEFARWIDERAAFHGVSNIVLVDRRP